MPAETIIEVVNINDEDALKAVVQETGVSEASKADRIASATRRAITESMDEDPTLYRRFSELLEETIRAYREKRLSEREYLQNVVELASKVAKKDRGVDVPAPIRGNDDAKAFFGILDGRLCAKDGTRVDGDEAASVALELIEIIKGHLIVDIWSNEVAQNNLRNSIDDYFFDVVRDEKGVDLSVEVLDDLELKIMDLARARSRMTNEHRRLKYGEQDIEYRVVRRARRTLEIAVEPDASVVIAAPLDASIEKIESTLRRRAAWVMRQQRYFSQFLPRTPERQFVAGETHLYLGRQYRLKIVPHAHECVKLLRGFIVVQTHRRDQPGLHGSWSKRGIATALTSSLKSGSRPASSCFPSRMHSAQRVSS